MYKHFSMIGKMSHPKEKMKNRPKKQEDGKRGVRANGRGGCGRQERIVFYQIFPTGTSCLDHAT